MPATLDEGFLSHMEKLSADSFDYYALVRDGRGGTWSMPPIVEGWDGDLFDFTSLGVAFDRTDIEVEYATIIQNSALEGESDDSDNPERGTLSGLAANKIQAGILSQRERAFRIRHTTPIMAACHAAARRKGHGQLDDQTVGIFGVIINHVNDMINVGG